MIYANSLINDTHPNIIINFYMNIMMNYKQSCVNTKFLNLKMENFHEVIISDFCCFYFYNFLIMSDVEQNLEKNINYFIVLKLYQFILLNCCINYLF